MKLFKTRFSDSESRLSFGMLEPGCWRFFYHDGLNDKDPAAVGPHYPSKESLLLHLEDYGREFGYDSCFNKLYAAVNKDPATPIIKNAANDITGVCVVCARSEVMARDYLRKIYWEDDFADTVKLTRIGVAGDNIPLGVLREDLAETVS